MGARFGSQHDTKHLILCAPLLPFISSRSLSLCFFSPKISLVQDSLTHHFTLLRSIFAGLPNQTLITSCAREPWFLSPNFTLSSSSRYTQFHWLLPRQRRVTPSLSSLPFSSLAWFSSQRLSSLAADFFARSLQKNATERWRRRRRLQISIWSCFLVLRPRFHHLSSRKTASNDSASKLLLICSNPGGFWVNNNLGSAFPAVASPNFHNSRTVQINDYRTFFQGFINPFVLEIAQNTTFYSTMCCVRHKLMNGSLFFRLLHSSKNNKKNF